MTQTGNRETRLRVSRGAAEAADEILGFKVETFRNKDLPLADRDKAADGIINRAFGRASLPLETPGEAPSIIYECRWLPSDPNNTGNVIEPTQGWIDRWARSGKPHMNRRRG